MSLTAIAALALFLAVILGWVLRWIYELLNPPPPPEPVADSEWAEYARAKEAEAAEVRARAEAAERDLQARLTQSQAELSAAMDALGEARRSVHQLEQELGRAGEDERS